MKNRCVITFEGLNVNSFINGIVRQNIPVFDVFRQGKQCILQVSASHSQKVVAQLKEKCYNILDVRYTGASFWLRFARKRLIALICAALCFASVAIFSQFCLKIETQGDFASEQVLAALDEAGVRIGTSFARFDADRVENAVSRSLNAMYTVVNRRGSVLYVNAVAAKKIDEPIDMFKRRDLVASFDGTVKSVFCEQGNLLVKVGDYVKAGDVLIEGLRVFNDGTSCEVYALGKVTLLRTCSATVKFDGERTITKQTGNVARNVGVVLFGREYVSACKYKTYETQTKKCYLQPLNLAVTFNTYFETVQLREKCSFEECTEELKSLSYQQALSKCDFVPQGVEYAIEGDTVKATLFATADTY